VPPRRTAVFAYDRPAGPVRQASHLAHPEPAGEPASGPAAAGQVGVDDLVRLAVERNPRIARATIAIDAARGRQVQAGLYPNPILAVTGDELGDRQGPGGIWTAPHVSQEIVTGRKLSLAQAVVAREVDQAALDVLAERYAVVGSVRSAFYEAFALQERLEILAELVRLAEQGVERGKTLLENRLIARLELIQLEVELERFRAEAASVEREVPAAYRRLAAVTGDSRLPARRLAGSFEHLPAYDLDQAREVLFASHPQARSARVGVDRAQAAIRQAEAQPIPNLTLSTGYVRQNQNRSDDWTIGLSAPIPAWNRNQGNIRTARAELAMAVQNVGRVENDLTERLATAYRTYDAARARAARYRTEILPRAEETYKLSLEAFKGGQFEYLRVIQSQRAVAEARLELNRSLGEAWRAAGEISGMLLEEVWPCPPAAPPGPGAAPARLPPPARLPDEPGMRR
jgi:cobalt-zinc-cadmium efflux system outer membrane protein